MKNLLNGLFTGEIKLKEEDYDKLIEFLTEKKKEAKPNRKKDFEIKLDELEKNYSEEYDKIINEYNEKIEQLDKKYLKKLTEITVEFSDIIKVKGIDFFEKMGLNE